MIMRLDFQKPSGVHGWRARRGLEDNIYDRLLVSLEVVQQDNIQRTVSMAK